MVNRVAKANPQVTVRRGRKRRALREPEGTLAEREEEEERIIC